VNEGSPIKRYDFEILADNVAFLRISEGNVTRKDKGALQPFTKSGIDFDIKFTVYY